MSQPCAKRIKTKLPLLAAGLAAALTAAACGGGHSSTAPAQSGGTATGATAGGSWQSTVAAAQKEGSLVWYTTNLPSESKGLVAAFNEAYPSIHVEVSRVLTGLGPNPVAARVFLDFMMSPAGQKALGVDGAFALPSVTGTLTQLSNVSVSKVTALTPSQLSTDTRQINSTFGR